MVFNRRLNLCKNQSSDWIFSIEEPFSRDQPTESCEKVHPAKSKCASRYSRAQSKISKCTSRYSGVCKNAWNKWATSAAPRGIQKSSFHHSFGSPTTTQWRKGCPSTEKICVLPQFPTSDQHEVRKRFAVAQKKLRFTTVLSVRRSLFALRVARPREKIAFHHSFERPTFTVNGCSAI